MTRMSASPRRSLNAAGKVGVQYQSARLPLSFQVNGGQAPAAVKYMAHGRGYTLSLRPDRTVLELPPVRKRSESPRAGLPAQSPAAITMKLVGAKRNARIEGEQKLPGTVSYLLGQDRSKWQQGLSTYARVRYEKVYPGTDLVYYGREGQLEYDFELEPGADPARIELAFTGADSLNMDANGDLVMTVAGREVRQHRPVIYQEVNGKRRPISGGYTLRGRRVAFNVGSYDRARPLVIDPTLSFATYLGGGDYDIANDIAVDSSGNAWITGITYYGGSENAFVRKVNSTGTAILLDITYGDAGEDEGNGIAVDAGGNVYVTGKYSYPWDFDPSIYLDHRLFVIKISPTGTVLYYFAPEGSMDDSGSDIAVDRLGYAYVTGYAAGGNVRGFPMVRGFQTQSSSPVYKDGIVMVLNPQGNSIVYSSYIAGGAITQGTGIAVDAMQRFYVTGLTGGNIPITPGAFQTQFGGWTGDAFVMKVDPALSGAASLIYSTYLGGDDFDQGNGIAVDAAGNAYVTGATGSNQAGVPYPTTPGAFQTVWGGGDCDASPAYVPCPDAFVTKLNPTGTALFYSTRIGGYASDTGSAITVDDAGNAYITGWGVADYPVLNSLKAFAGGKDVAVTKLNPAGSALVWSTFLGGSDYDLGTGIARDANGNIYVTGYTASTNFPVTAGAVHPTYYGGGEDPFIVKLTDSSATALNGISVNPAAVTGGASSIGTVTLGSAAPAGGAVVSLVSSNTAAATVPATITVAAGATTASFTVTTKAVTADTAVTLTATYNGVSKTAAVTVKQPVPDILSVTPASLAGGNNATGTVTLTGPAPAGGAVVTLNSSNTTAVTVPASVTVAAGAKTATFAASAKPVTNTTTVTLAASRSGVDKSASLTVVPAALVSLAVTPASIAGGNNATATVTLSGTAPTGGIVVALTSSNTAVATLPASVTVAAGAKTANVAVSTKAVNASTAVTLTAAYSGVQKTAALTAIPAALSSLAVNPMTPAGGNTATGTVTLTGTAPTGGIVVTLSSSSPAVASVPASVTVAAGAKSVNFSIATTIVAGDTPVTITAAYAGVSKTAAITVKPTALYGLSFNPTVVTGGNNTTGSVTITGPAPAGGVVVTLTNSNPGVLTIPSSVTIAAGAKSATFVGTTSILAADATATVAAVYSGVTKSVTVTVKPTALSALSLSPASLTGGSSATGTVTLTGPAPAGGVTVTLSSGNTAVASVPTSVSVAAGAKTATFVVATTPVSADTTVTLTASYAGVTKTTTLSVKRPAVSSLTISPSTVKGGGTSTGTIQLNGVAPAGGTVVTLTSSNAVAGVPASITLPAGAGKGAFTITTGVVTVNTSSTISASVNGVTKTAVITVTP